MGERLGSFHLPKSSFCYPCPERHQFTLANFEASVGDREAKPRKRPRHRYQSIGPIMRSDRELRNDIAMLKELEGRCFTGRQRFAFYGYLAAVYELYERLRRNKEANKGARRISSLCGLPTNRSTHPIRTILDATSSADEKTKSRWTRALKFAWHERQRWKNFEKVLRQHGGPAGCADQFAVLHVKPPKGYITFSTPGYARVSPFV
jgi:hypothetical protein